MNEINHFKILYYAKLDRWCSIDLTIGGW
jgi:hypothetical protein